MAQHRIETWPQFTSQVGPFLFSPDPVHAMQQAGFLLGDTLLSAFRKRPVNTSRSQVIETLTRKFGPPPPTRLHLGSDRPAITPRLKPGDDQARFSIDLDVINQILQQLWHATTLPQVYDPDIFDTLQIRLSDLRELCVGVPPAAQKLGNLTLLTPPVLSPGRFAPTAVHVSVRIRIGIQDFAQVLTGDLEVELPLTFADFPLILWVNEAAAQNVQAAFTVDPSSTIAPASADAGARLSAIFQNAVSILVLDLPEKVSFPAPIVDEFQNADGSVDDKVMVAQIDAVTRPGGVGGYLTAGVNITSQAGRSAGNLSGEPRPPQGSNVHVAIDDSFATDLLKQAILTGTVDRLVTEQMGGNITLTFHAGTVLFDAGVARVVFDATAHNVCPFTDLDMTLTVTGTVAVSNGQLSLQQPSIDIDLSDIDAVVCTVTGIAAGLVTVVLYAVALPLLSSLISPPAGQSTSIFSPMLIPGAEADVTLALNSASTDISGNLLLNALASVVPDTTHYFVYLRIVSGTVPQLYSPVVQARVELLELENPAPAGDDVHPENLKPGPGQKISYKPSNDQHLGTQVTDSNGVVRFAVIPSTIAGVATETKTVEDPRTGALKTVVTGRQDVFEAHPDFGINVTGADGSVMAKRLLVALNVGSHDFTDKHVGSFDRPLIVNLGSIATAGNPRVDPMSARG